MHWAALASLAFALACGSSDPQPSGAPLARKAQPASAERDDNQAPTVDQLVLHPPRPLPGQQIEARIEARDPDGDPIRLALEWRQDGRVILRGTQTTVAPEQMRKGQQIEVLVTATDGRDTSEPLRAAVTVGNQAPLVQALYLAPDGEVAPGQDVTAAPQASDPDGDALDYEFEWRLNGNVVRGAEQARFDTAKLKRGDRLQARVRVSDGDAESPWAETMTLELANRAPRFAGLPAIVASDGEFRAELEAQDPDGDRSLRYRVITGPAGLSVDAVRGQLRWRPDPDAVGTHPVEVAVGDSFGAESAIRFELTVASSVAEAPPPAKPRASDEELD
jgi:hypothetical protein